MRDSNLWIEKLRRLMGGRQVPSTGMKFTVFARIEMLLYALQQYFPSHPIEKAHLLLQGYREPSCSDRQWRILRHLRHLVPEFQSAISWEIALRQYCELADESETGIFGFSVDIDTNRLLPIRSMFANRFLIYEEFLSQEPLRFRKQTYKPTPQGVYSFSLDPYQSCTIQISDEIAAIGKQQVSEIPDIETEPNRAPIQISLQTLIETGRELSSILGYNAGKVIEQSTYLDTQSRNQADSIVINQTAHIVGPTGSGKSTVVDCLVAKLVDQGKRVAIATNSVAEVQDWLLLAQKLGIKAVPVIGESEKHHHLSRLNQATMLSDKQQPFDHPGFRWLSQACPLFEIVKQDEASLQIPQSNHEKRYKPPCFRKLEDISDGKKYDCPLVTVCPRHISANELRDAQLIVGTLPGFIYKKIARHNLSADITTLEYLALTSDLFIIDEVDLTQPKLDEMFYPTAALASFKDHQSTWTRTESYQHVHGLIKGEVVVLDRLTDPFLEKSEEQRSLANLSISALMYLIRDLTKPRPNKSGTQNIEKVLKQYVKEGKLFSAWSFFENLAQQLSGKTFQQTSQCKIHSRTLAKYERSYERYREIFKRVQNDPVRPDRSGLSSADAKIVTDLALVSGILLAGDRAREVPHPDCFAFIENTKWDTDLSRFEENLVRFEENLAKLLQLAIYAAHFLGALGKHLSARQRATTHIDTSFPLTPPRDFKVLLPNSPVGSVTSAQFKDGQLRVFRGIALGRSLLRDWHSIFSIDDIAPAHLMVTSATSYSGLSEQSYPFHVQLPPTLLIQPPVDKQQAVAHHSEFFYCPVLDEKTKPIFVSGRQGEKRYSSVAKMALGLCHSEIGSQSLFDQFQSYLENTVGIDRKNLLIVTNSYAESKAFYVALRPPFKEKASYVVADGQWATEEQVARSKLTEFPRQDRELLIAPMGAISRAVNLMHPSTGEPFFGGIAIAVRQHPSPDDHQAIVSAVGKEVLDMMGRSSVTDIQRRARTVQNVFLSIPQIFSKLPESPVSNANISMKLPLVWTLAVNLTQLIGRSTRGGRKSVIWFLDAAFMPETANGNPSGDMPNNSVLLAVRKLLGNAINKGDHSAQIIETLYGPIYHPLTRLKHFIHGAKL